MFGHVKVDNRNVDFFQLIVKLMHVLHFSCGLMAVNNDLYVLSFSYIFQKRPIYLNPIHLKRKLRNYFLP